MKTCLHILLGKRIQMLENEAEVLYYCNDRAFQNCCLKTSIIGQFTLLSDTTLQSYTKRVIILQPLLSVRVIHILSKEP